MIAGVSVYYRSVVVLVCVSGCGRGNARVCACAT